MSGRFVSGGTIGTGEDTEAGADSGSINRLADGPDAARKAAEWDKVQEQLDADRRRRAQAARAAGGEEPSLYDVLQSNKAAKEAAAAEASKLTNQFRALDDDEVAFLDEVRARRRAEEESVRRETEEGLEKFRRRTAATREEGHGIEQEDKVEGESWGMRKRKRGREREGGKGMGVVRRRVMSGGEEGKKDGDEEKKLEEKKIEEKNIEGKNTAKSGEEKQSKKLALALVDYGSDSDE
ncbi:NEFA-interacting nuclear protein NIP30 [Beauveria brongniartii RCEF 3172]|uniref:NEFA-interacting nuclear protein NIP30 n=1 Tax=Beauveria brongniartii RCEF 3172 TaxID=1081107 RepID=A0A162M1Y6_9HYPO|nr:NEFA-interacting nuclear protein NIP30 [Beauveria brongniartii RCEF 3172]